MSKGKLFYRILAIASTLALLLQGCRSQPTPAATPSPTPERAFAPSLSIPEFVYSTASLAPTPEEATPSPAPTPSPTPTAKPKPVAYSTKGFITHDYAASDGKKIYYFANDGVHCMNKNGSGDTLTSIVYCHQFLSFNTRGLYYVASDNDDASSEGGSYWESVMVYDAGTQATKPIKNHVYDTIILGSKIYMIDGMNHSHILCYDMSKGTLTDIKGLPSKFKGEDIENFLYEENGQVYVQCPNDMEWEIYVITGNKVAAYTEPPTVTTDTEPPQETQAPNDYDSYYETDDGALYRLDYQTQTLAAWNGSEYSDLDIPFVSDVIVSGTKLYIFTYEYKDNWPDDDFVMGGTLSPAVTGSPYALYRLSTDGTFEKLFEGVDKVAHDSGLGDSPVCDMIDGWYFTFWMTNVGDSEYLSGLLFKKKVG